MTQPRYLVCTASTGTRTYQNMESNLEGSIHIMRCAAPAARSQSTPNLRWHPRTIVYRTWDCTLQRYADSVPALLASAHPQRASSEIGNRSYAARLPVGAVPFDHQADRRRTARVSDGRRASTPILTFASPLSRSIPSYVRSPSRTQST